MDLFRQTFGALSNQRPSTFQADKNWHVSVLLEAYPSTETLVPGELYSLAISRESVRVVVLIELPESFPNTAPLVSCTPSFRHEWLNATSGQVVAHPALSRWTPPGVANGTTSVLVAVIRDLEAAIAASPKTESLKSPPPRQTLLSFGTVDTSYEKTLGGNDLMVIDALSPEHVSELLAAEEKLDKFISNLPASRQHTAVLDEMLEENIKVARANLRIRDETMDLKQTLDSALKDYDLAIESFNNFLLLHAEQLKKCSPDSLANRVKTDLKQRDESSYRHWQQGIAGNEPCKIDPLVREYLKLRQEYHRQAILFQRYQHLQQNPK